MGFRNIIITKSMNLSVKNNQLVINDYTVPLEDINSIMIENQAVTLTSRLINEIADYGIACYICNEKHIPLTMILPIERHSRHFQMLNAQIHISKVVQKRLWKEIVKQKIYNQSLCLRELDKDGQQELNNMISEVLAGDKSNIEAKAAASYFRFLFGERFIRREENVVNSALNYCYSIIRGQIARSVMCHGLEPSIGLNHRNQLNSFNLVDDFIEPYRAIADYYVADSLDKIGKEETFTSEHKHMLVNVNQQDVFINEGRYTISKSIDLMVGSYVSILNGQRENLLLPQLMHKQIHNYE